MRRSEPSDTTTPQPSPPPAGGEPGHSGSAADRMSALAFAAAGVVRATTEDDLFAVLRESCARVLQVDAFTFGLYDPAAHALRFLEGVDAGEPLAPRFVPLAGTPAERVVRERRPLLTLRSSDPRAEGSILVGGGRRSESVIRCPVVADGEVLAMISIQSYTPAAYDESDVEVVEILAANAATALLNLRFRRDLARREDRHRTLLEHSHDLTVVVDDAGILTYVSPSSTRILGRSPSELLGRSVFDLMPEEERARAREELEIQVDGEAPPVLRSYRFLHRDGDWRTLEVIGRNLFGHPEIRGVVFNARDISDRRRAELRVEAALSRLRAAQAVANVGDWEYDLRTGTVTWSEELYRIYGVPQDAPVDYRTFMELVHPADRADVEAASREGRESGGWYRVDHRIVRPDGSVRHIHGRGHFERDQDGAPVRIFGTSQDVTELRQVEQALRSAQERMRLFLAQMPVLLWMCDTDLRFTWGEGAGLQAIGEELRFEGVSLYDYFGTEHERFLPIAMHRRALGGEAVSFEMTWRERIFEAHVEPVRDEAGHVTGALGFALDVSERRMLERQLQEAQRMEAVGRLAGGVAHDFNNILTVIDGHANLMLQEVGEEGPLRADLEEVRRAAARASDLTRQLLAFSRRQVLRPRVLDLNETVIEMKRMLHRLIGEDIRLHTDLAEDLGLVEVDPAQLEQVLLNLVVNARDAMPGGGSLTICTRNATVTETGGGSPAPGEYVRLDVVDTGHGMDPDIAERAFDPFFTTKGEGRGTGLGLATVYGIVKQSGGWIEVESAPASGTRFRIHLPRASGRPDAPPPPQDAEHARGGTETILVVEDEEAVRTLTRRILERKGYRVLEASDGAEALRMCERHDGPIDLVLTDVVMPLMSGTELVERLRGDTPALRSLFMSGYTEDEVLRRGIVADELPFLQKPFTPEALARKVRDVLDAEAGEASG